jgi:hypothetical protein
MLPITPPFGTPAYGPGQRPLGLAFCCLKGGIRLAEAALEPAGETYLLVTRVHLRKDIDEMRAALSRKWLPRTIVTAQYKRIAPEVLDYAEALVSAMDTKIVAYNRRTMRAKETK